MTTVVSVRNRKPSDFGPNFIYVGRQEKGWSGSKWGNPFRTGHGYAEVCETMRRIGMSDHYCLGCQDPLTIYDAFHLYDKYLVINYGLIHEIDELRDKELGCWCGSWSPGMPIFPCHACLLALIANKEK